MENLLNVFKVNLVCESVASSLATKNLDLRCKFSSPSLLAFLIPWGQHHYPTDTLHIVLVSALPWRTLDPSYI